MLVDPETGRPRKFAYAPGLVVVDGGPPQVAAAQRALDELGIDDIPVCGLAKRLEEVWLPDQEDPVILPRTSEGLYLLQRVRDEAHRFAITHHRVAALQVDGREPARRRARARRGAPQDPAQALRLAEEARGPPSVDEIAQVPGIGAAHRHRRSRMRCAPRRRAASTGVSREHRHRRDRGGADGRHRDRAATGPDHAGELVVVTGMTGAGRSTAAKELEDLGFYVVDNLPPALLRDVVAAGRREPRHRASRSRSWSTSAPGRSSTSLQANLAQRATGRRTTLLFLEATDDVLVRRQEAARRPHPLQGGGRLLDGLRREREVLADLRGDADLVIDTSDLNVHQLTDRIAEAFGTPDTTRLKVTVISFGFKYGIPVDADFVADMRFLPNPLLGARAARADRPGPRGRRLRARARTGARGVPRPLRPGAAGRRRGLPRARASGS